MAVVSEGAKKPKKVLKRLEIHPGLNGQHMVRHVYHDHRAEPKEYNFKDPGDMIEHVGRHLGIPLQLKGIRKNESETEDEV